MTSRRLVGPLVALLLTGTAPAVADEAIRADALIGLARVQRDRGDMAGAAASFREARHLRAFDTSLLAEYFWVEVAVDATRGLAVGTEVLSREPAHAGVRDRSIAAAVAAQDEDRAEALARAGETVSPGTALWARRLGESLLRQRRPADAAKAFARAAASPDAQPRDAAALAVALEGAGAYAEALEVWHTVDRGALAPDVGWDESRLRALVHAGDPVRAASELEGRLAADPARADLRAALVDVWLRAGNRWRALEAMHVLVQTTNAEVWLRRRLDLALDLGELTLAAADLERLNRRGADTVADLERLARASLARGSSVDAEAALAALVGRGGPCRPATIDLLASLPDPSTLARVLASSAARCPADTARLVDTARRLLGTGDAAVALGFLRQAAPGRREVALRELEGELLLWTGNSGEAAAVLAEVVAHDSSRTAAMHGLVDAYRAIGRIDDAWRLVESLVASARLDATRWTTAVEVALDTGRAAQALAWLEAGSTVPVPARDALRGRALVALGRPAEALDVFAAVPVAAMGPATAVAWADAIERVRGMGAALDALDALPVEAGPVRVELDARRALWLAVVGDCEAAVAARERVAAHHPIRATLLDAEILLRRHEPRAALPLLEAAVARPDAPIVAWDLLATARAGARDFAGARAALARVQAAEPERAVLAAREVDWRWREAPSDDGLHALVTLARRHADDAGVRAVVAAALDAAGRPDDALTTLGGSMPAWARLPVDGRAIAARSLRALGRLDEAWSLVDSVEAPDPATALLAAELLAATRGYEAARARFAALASSRPTPAVYLAWAAAAPSASEAADVLDRGGNRFGGDAELAEAAAQAHWRSGHARAARAAAERTLAVDPRRASAWAVALEATLALGSDAEAVALADHLEATLGGEPLALLAPAGAIAAGTRDTHLMARALAWTGRAIAAAPASRDARMAHARALGSAGRANEAADALASWTADHPDDLEALRLRAELLSYGGAHARALAAYDEYLSRAPDDVQATRQQARVASWAGDHQAVRQRYAALASRQPHDEAIAAERRAKEAFLAGRYADAADAYRRWLALEPDDREAAFELAQSLVSLGRLSEAAHVYDTLAHRPMVSAETRDAIDAFSRQEALETSPFTSHRSSSGFDGLRLVDLAEAGARVRFGPARPMRLSFAGARLTARGADRHRTGARAGVELTGVFGEVRVEGSAGWRDAGAGGLAEGLARVTWRFADRWRAAADVDRLAFIENLATLDARLAAAGVSLGTAYETPALVVDLRGSWHHLSDGNRRRSLQVDLRRRLVHGRDELWVIGRSEHLAFADAAVQYFSPGRILRYDGGLEWRHWIVRPRFREQADRYLSFGYSLGGDDRRQVYHHPYVAVSYEIRPGVAVEARGAWLRSAVYEQTDVRVSLRLGGGKPR